MEQLIHLSCLLPTGFLETRGVNFILDISPLFRKRKPCCSHVWPCCSSMFNRPNRGEQFVDVVEVRALKEKRRWYKQYISEAECFELVWKRPRGDVDSSRSHTLSSLSAKKITEWGRGACWSFPRWWQDGLWDVSFSHPTSLKLIWQRQNGSVKFFFFKTLSWGWVSPERLCLFVSVQNQGLVIHGQHHDGSF